MKPYHKLSILFIIITPFELWAVNPVFTAADPHAVVYGDTVYIYPTYGSRGKFYVFSSSDLVSWKREGPILDFSMIDWIPWGKYAWAPAITEKKGVFYFYYSVGPKPSHIGVATGITPMGPFKDSGRALLSDNNDPAFEAIDPMVFQDPNSSKHYLYAGGSAGAKLRMFELNDNMTTFAREIEVQTPPAFTEGVFMHYRNGTYYLSYSHGGWQTSSYSVHYATAHGPMGPWKYQGCILSSNETFKGPGHHSFLRNPVTDQWYIVYHRWEYVSGDGPYPDSRKTAIDKLEYDSAGLIKPVTMTSEGVAKTTFGQSPQ